MSTTQTEFLRYLRTLTAQQATGLLSDQQLLERFLHERSEASFVALVARHGPMVWSVCRRVLQHAQDAEEAFQATFLVLVRKANSIRKQSSLGSWLHGVAFHRAQCLKAKTMRRIAHERRWSAPPHREETDDLTWRELRSVLDEELTKLPVRNRSPLVLCYLEGKTQDEAAQQLGWSKNTFRRRLDQGREMLGRRLTRRGVTLSVALSVPLLADAATLAALPPLLAATTVRAGMALALGQSTGDLVSAQVVALAEAGARSLLAKKTIAAVLLIISLMLGVGGFLTHRALPGRTFGETPSAPKTEPSAPSRLGAARADKENPIEIKGRVLGPEGKPVVGARLFLLSAVHQKKADLPVRTTTDAEGQFRFTARPTDFGSQGEGKIVAAAKGFGLDWVEVKAKDKKDEITLHLVVDDVSITGRMLDLEGKPIAGVAIRVLHVGRVPHGADLKPWLDKNVEMRRKGTYLNEGGLEVLRADLLYAPARTGTDGAFRLTGFGRDRVVRLDIEGPNIVWRKMWAVTRPGPAGGFIPGFWGVYGANFEYLASPCKPIVGTVRERGTGKPLAGITVGSAMHGDVETTTDKEGRYRIVGVAKNPRYAIVAEGDHYFNCTKFDIGDTVGLEPITVDFELERGILIRGRLINKITGAPVRGMVTYCARADNPRLKDFKELGSSGHIHLRNSFDTTSDGSFTALGIPGPGLLVARADNGLFIEALTLDAKGAPFKTVPNIILTGHHALVPVHISENDPKTHVCNIALDPGRSVNGAVVGLDGKPLTGVRITGLTSTRTESEGQARKDAAFQVMALEPGRDRRLIFLHEEKKLGKMLHLRGDEKGPLTVKLEPLGIVTGRMVDAAGRPLAGLTVRIRQDNPIFDNLTTTTDRDGRFRIECLLPRTKFVLAIARGDPWKRHSTIVFFEVGLSVESGTTKDLGDLKPKPPPRK